MKPIKEFALWWAWFGQTKGRLSFLVLLVSVIVLFVIPLNLFRQGLKNGQFILMGISVLGFVLLGVFLAGVGSSAGYVYSSKNWRIAVERGRRFIKKHSEARSEIEPLIRETELTKNPSKLHNYIEEWKSPEEKMKDLQRELDYKRREVERKEEELEDIEELLSGRKAERIQEEIEKTKGEIEDLENQLKSQF